MNVIETMYLTKSYGKNRGIIDVNLTVEKGDFFGFIGPNGAGKSTMIRTLLGLIKKTSGDAKVFGIDVGMNKPEILEQIGYLPSELEFYHGMKVKDVLKLSSHLHHKDCMQEAKRLCALFELDMNRKVDELSLGNRKKVGIVCAMSHRPKLYILDEATSGLDPLMQHTFYKLLQERNQEGATIFLSSHVLSEVQKYCRHAAFIKDGKLIVSDCVENISSNKQKKVCVISDEALPQIEGMHDIKQDQNQYTFHYQGDMQVLLEALSTIVLKDVTICDLDLEDIFLHYYEKGNDYVHR